MRQELEGKHLQLSMNRAREELHAKSVQREKQNATSLVEERANRLETLKTLESVEDRVKSHAEKAH